MDAYKNTVEEESDAFGSQIRNGPVESVLSSLYRGICNDLKIETSRLKQSLLSLIQRQNASLSGKEVFSRAGNLINEFQNERMTWKVFLQGLEALRIVKAVFVFTFHFDNDRQSTVIQELAFDPMAFKVQRLKYGYDVLSKFHQELQNRESVELVRFNELFKAYAERMKLPKDARSQSMARSSLVKEFQQPHISWKVFNKALLFLGISRYRVLVQLHHYNKIVTDHELLVSLSTNFVEEDFGFEETDDTDQERKGDVN